MDQEQEKKRIARTQDWYDTIWMTVGKCVFCDLKEKYILYEENGIVLTINIYPYIDGHLMAIPRRHVMSPKDLTQLEWETMRKFAYIGKKIIRKVHGLKGMWTLIREGGIVSNATVDHLHMQIIPFDAPDLCKWNYRELKNTPLENVEKYKEHADEFVDSYKKFEKKYSNRTNLPVVCDLVMINPKGEVLFQERKSEFKVYPDILTLPGGHLDNADNSLISSLQKEIKEETNYEFQQDDVELLDSRIGKVYQVKDFNKFGKKLATPHVFIWNSYLLTNFDDSQKLVPGDDCEKFEWIDIDKISTHSRVSKEVKALISDLILRMDHECDCDHCSDVKK